MHDVPSQELVSEFAAPQHQHRHHHQQHGHHQHQPVMFLHRGHHCMGQDCEFTQSIRHWQSMIRLQRQQENNNEECTFQSEVVEKAPLSLAKLDEKRKNLSQMREILSAKLESKHRSRQKRKERKKQVKKIVSRSESFYL